MKKPPLGAAGQRTPWPGVRSGNNHLGGRVVEHGSNSIASAGVSEPTQLSKATYERLRDELEQLTTEGRVKIAHTIEQARLLGDLSENADYHAAKDDQGRMEARIRQLEAMLESAVIVDDTTGGATDGIVRTGTIVGLRYEGDDDVERYLVGSIEERPEGVSVISPGSPLGQALMGASQGDVVSYSTPTGAELSVRVVRVELP